MKKAFTCILALALLLSGTAAFAESASVLPYEGDEITITMLGWQSFSDYDWDTSRSKRKSLPTIRIL